MNHYLLGACGVSTPELDQICNIVRKHKISAKLTGAGGGGFVLCLIPPNVDSAILEAMTSSIRELGYQVFDTRLSVPGVQMALLDSNDSLDLASFDIAQLAALEA